MANMSAQRHIICYYDHMNEKNNGERIIAMCYSSIGRSIARASESLQFQLS